MILTGSFQVVPVIIVIATFGLVFASVYSLIMMQRAYYGAPKSETPLAAMNAREFTMILILVVLVVLLGIFPQPILDTSSSTMGAIQHWFNASLTMTRQ